MFGKLLNPDHIEWTRNLLNTLKIGGRWGIPAYQAVVERTGEKTVRIAERGNDEAELELLQQHIVAAGFTIEDNK